MKFTYELLSESGNISTMRVMGLISLLAGVGIAAGGMIMGKDLTQLAVLSGVFVTSAFGGKVVQKMTEGKE